MQFSNTLPTLNEAQTKVFAAVCEAAERMTGGDFTYADEVIEYLPGMTMKSLRGYLTALIKKGLINIDTEYLSQICGTDVMEQGGRYNLCAEYYPEYFAKAEEAEEADEAPEAPAAAPVAQGNAKVAFEDDCSTIVRQVAGDIEKDVNATEFRRKGQTEYICEITIVRPSYRAFLDIQEEMSKAWGDDCVTWHEIDGTITWSVYAEYSL